MTVVGINNSIINTKFLEGYECPYCKIADKTTGYISVNYAHLSFIPVFSLGKVFSTECSHCKLLRRDLRPPKDENNVYYKFLRDTKIPAQYYIGSIVIFTFIVVTLFSLGLGSDPMGNSDSGKAITVDHSLDPVNDPKINDVFFITQKNALRGYFYKIVEESDSTITLIKSANYFDPSTLVNETNLKLIDEKKNFWSNEKVKILKIWMSKLWKEHNITDCRRPKIK